MPHTMTDSNPPMLTTLTCGTVITALVSAWLLSAAGPGLPIGEEALRLEAQRQPAEAKRQTREPASQRKPAGASSNRTH